MITALFMYLGIYLCINFSFIYLLINFSLHWVFVAVRGLSLVAAHGSYSSLWCAGSVVVARRL